MSKFFEESVMFKNISYEIVKLHRVRITRIDKITFRTRIVEAFLVYS